MPHSTMIDQIEKKENALSVVIATLGGESLKDTIASLLNGSKVPDEILICIPADHAKKAEVLTSGIVKVIATEVKGQVKQRAQGFDTAVYPLVLQLDDDILLGKEVIEKLASQVLQLGKGNVIGPIYYGKKTGLCIHKLQNGVVKNLFDSIICAAGWGKNKMGTVSAIGINYGVDDSLCKAELMQSQWLPGGCVLSFKEDLVRGNFFPFEGKAYCEDVYHSYYRSLANTNMWVSCKTKVVIDEPIPELSKQAVEKVIAIRRRFLGLIKGPAWRLSIYELFCRIRSKVYE
jgi:glycosyltransferase involved in cell wall biosynthesis